MSNMKYTLLEINDQFATPAFRETAFLCWFVILMFEAGRRCRVRQILGEKIKQFFSAGTIDVSNHNGNNGVHE